MAAVDCESMWKVVFGRFPTELFNDPFLAHELLRFLRLNQESIGIRVPQYTRYFPNLLKVKSWENMCIWDHVQLFIFFLHFLSVQFLAWDSPAMVDDFVDLLPSMVTAGTAVELLHTLLDLPCLSATLVLQLRFMHTKKLLTTSI